MRILQVANIKESVGGPFVSVLNFHLALHAFSHQNTLISIMNMIDFVRLKNSPHDMKVIPIFENGKETNPKRFNLKFIGKFLWNLKHFDVVHLHGFFIFNHIPMIILCRLFKKKISIQPHGSLMNYELAQLTLSKKGFLFIFKLLVFGISPIFVVTSKLECEQLPRKLVKDSNQIFLTRYFRSEMLLYNNQDQIDLSKIVNSQNMKILFLGRVTKKKNLSLLIEATKFANERGAKCDLIVVGPIDFDQSYLLNHGRIILGENFIFLGPIYSRNIKDQIMKLCHIFALPSIGENFALSIVEADSSGLHLLLSPHIGAIEILKDADITIVSDLRLESWGNALIALSTSLIRGKRDHFRIPYSADSWLSEASKYSFFLDAMSK